MAIEKYEANPHLGNGFEGALLVSKTIAASELSSYPEKLTAEFDKPYEIWLIHTRNTPVHLYMLFRSRKMNSTSLLRSSNRFLKLLNIKIILQCFMIWIKGKLLLNL